MAGTPCQAEQLVPATVGASFRTTLDPRPTSILNLPEWATYSRRTGVLSGNPTGWGNFDSTAQRIDGSTNRIRLAVIPSTPVIRSGTNWRAQLGQSTTYQIVAGGAGREWAGFDDFSSNGSKWILSGSRGTTLLLTNGALLNRSTQATASQDGLAYWQRLMPRTANWEIWMRAFLPTNGLPAQNFKLGLFLLNQARNNSQVWEVRHYFSPARYVAQYKQLDPLTNNTKLDVSLGSSPRAEYDLTMRFTASNGVLRGFVFDGVGNVVTNQTLPLPRGLGSSFSPGIISECNGSTLNPTSTFSADDFLILPDPDDIEYRAFLVGTNTLPEGLEVDSRTGLLAGVIPTNVLGGIYRIRVEAEYKTNNLPRQGIAAVRGGTNVTLTLLPAFTGTNAATFLLNTNSRSHTVAVSPHSFGTVLRYSAIGLPKGLVIGNTTGVIGGRPTVAGTFATRVTITAGAATAFQDLLLSVQNGEGNRWAVGIPVSYQVNLGAGVTGYRATGLPTGLSINASSGLISGTPTQVGEFNVTVSVPARGLSTVMPFFIRPIYVNLAATGANNGTSWADAYTNLQTAINAAGAGSQIWVAAGTYKPTQFMDRKVRNNARSRSFVLKGGVSIVGGFAGTEKDLAQRNLTNNVTTLSGDFSGNDSATWPPDSTRNENAYHVLVALGQTSPVVLDGLVITGGNANDSVFVQPSNGFILPGGVKPHQEGGGGIILDSDLVIRNSWVENNAAATGGGFRVYNLNPPTVRKFRAVGVVFYNNLATHGDGGALDIQAHRLTSPSNPLTDAEVGNRPVNTSQFMLADFVRCVFDSNEARTGPDRQRSTQLYILQGLDGLPDGGQGGAVCLRRATVNVVGCVFYGNYANRNGMAVNVPHNSVAEGGAILARPRCTLRVATSVFMENRSDRKGGAISTDFGVATTLNFNLFFKNSCSNPQRWGATAFGGYYDSPWLNSLEGFGNIFWQNSGVGEEITWGAQSGHPNSTRLNQTLVTAGSLANNIGTIIGSDPLFFGPINPEGADGLWFTEDDGLRIRAGSPAALLANSARPNDFADLDDDGNTTEPLPFDAAGVAYPANPPYHAGPYQTLAP